MQRNVVSCPQSLYIDKAFCYRGGTDDAECDVSDGGPRISDRAK
ncbi:hypothetical protein ALP28_04370, partial [Pseudomonas savastanoi pv. nerii]